MVQQNSVLLLQFSELLAELGHLHVFLGGNRFQQFDNISVFRGDVLPEEFVLGD